MANIKSAKKRILVINKKTERNKAIRSKVKTYIKRVYAAIDENNKEAANAALTEAISELSKAASKGVYHKSTASRKISRMTKAVNAIQ
ncbi:MAG: 30S ribosomal protein S20 [Lachnospiraceae bacterium]|nr:30S ribosomal protein S20 [Lachnospiraceae bacterium]